jgi:hypothetical protein
LLLETGIKKALDRVWSDGRQKAAAVDVLPRQVMSLERWLEGTLPSKSNIPRSAMCRRSFDRDAKPTQLRVIAAARGSRG